jgi:26S proteasome regulatory subunit N10
MDVDEDALLQQALAMSMQSEMDAAGKAEGSAAAVQAAPAPAVDDAAMFDVEDEELRQALAMSMQDAGPGEQVTCGARQV